MQRGAFPIVRHQNQCCGSQGLFMPHTDFFLLFSFYLPECPGEAQYPWRERYECKERERETISFVLLLSEKRKKKKNFWLQSSFHSSTRCLSVRIFASARGCLANRCCHDDSDTKKKTFHVQLSGRFREFWPPTKMTSEQNEHNRINIKKQVSQERN